MQMKKNPRKVKFWLSAFLVFTMVFGIFTLGISPVEAKTLESARAENIFFYVTDKDGKNVLLDVMSYSELEAISHGQLSDLLTGTDTGKNYYFSCTDNLPTTSYTEARGFTLPELIDYVKEHSQVQGAGTITYTGNDKLYFMATDSNGSYNRNWTYNQLYEENKYYFPGLFTFWKSDWEISDSTYGPTDTNPIPLDIYNSTYKDSDIYYDVKRTVFENGERTVPILVTKLQMNRTLNLSAEIAANDGEVTGCMKDALNSDRALQLCMPQSEAILMSGNRTAYHYFAWIYNMKLVMADAPDIASFGTVDAPTATISKNGNTLSITMDCTTEGAQIYYSLIDNAPQTLYTGEAVTWDIGDRNLASSPVTFTMTAVKAGYDDAGIIAVTYPQRAPALTDIYTATVGNDVAFTATSAVSSDAWNSWSHNITEVSIKYPGTSAYTKLNEDQYTVDDSTKTITFDKLLFSTYGSHSFQICADGYANKNISVTMKKVAPTVEIMDYYLGSDIVLSFADGDYQGGISVRVKAEGAAATIPIGSTYLKQSAPGKLIIDKTYFSSANCAITSPGTYILTLTNSNYDPSAQTISINVKPASEKPEGDNFIYTLASGVSKCQVGEPITINVDLLSGADSYKFYAGEYRLILDNASLTLDTVTTRDKWKSGTRTTDEETILTFAALDETDKGVISDKVTKIGSFVVTPLRERNVSIMCTKVLLTDADAQALSKVEGNGLQVNIVAAPTACEAEQGKNITITPNNPVIITIPPEVTETGIEVTQDAPLPTVNVQSTQVDMTISEDTEVSGSDIIKLPEVIPPANVDVTISGQVDLAIKVGSDSGTITFSKPVRLVLRGMGKKSAGFIDNDGVFQEISKPASLDGLTGEGDTDAVVAVFEKEKIQDGAVDSGNDLIIWTKHFTTFIAYTPPKYNELPVIPIPEIIIEDFIEFEEIIRTQTISSRGCIIKIPGAMINFPAGAVSEDVEISIKKVGKDNIPLVRSAYRQLGSVYEITTDKKITFNKPVTITMYFDKDEVDNDKYDVGIYCWGNQEWVLLDQVQANLEAGKVSGSVNHFSIFAVLLSKKGEIEINKEKEPAKEVVAPVKRSFKDITGHWAEANINKLANTGAISGYPDGTFRPDNSITRAEFATALVIAFKLEPRSGKVFSDTSGHWARDAISVAAAHGVVSGYDETTFGPDDLITREQMAVMISKAAGLSGGEGKTFTDSAQISDWAKAAVAAASSKNIIGGYPDNTFRPQAYATRAEAVTIIVKVLD